MLVETEFNGDNERLHRLRMLESAAARAADAHALADDLDRDLNERRQLGLIEPSSKQDINARMAVARIRQIGTFELLDREVDDRLKDAAITFDRVFLLPPK